MLLMLTTQNIPESIPALTSYLARFKISKAFFKLQKAGKRLAATQAIIVHGSHLTLVELGISSNSQTRFWGVL